jgi:hypothetical protein
MYKSVLNISFTHNYYLQFESAINQVESNNYIGSKPFTYNEFAAYYDIRFTANRECLNL